MNRNKARQRQPGIWLAALIVLLVSLGCGWSAVPTVGGAQASPPANDATVQALQSIRSGLDGLDSYRMTLKVRFTGHPEGSSQEQTVSIDTLEEAAPGSVGQPVRHLLFLSSSTSGEAGPNLPGALEYYQIGSLNYALSSVQSSDPACQPVNTDTIQNGPLLAGSVIDLLPQFALQSFRGAQPTGQAESVNGVLSDHYRLEATQSADGLNQVDGDVWIAQNGGYVVRFRGALQGPVAINILNGSGVLGWEYNLTDVNAIDQVSIPEQCLVLHQEAPPLPDNAQNVLQNNTLLSYTSTSTPSDLLAFYQASLPAQGWQIDQEGGGSDRYSLDASQGKRFIRITITQTSDGATQVSIEALAALP